jgi:peroxiredoxin/tetratricopeptide (TPR) repeat protein
MIWNARIFTLGLMLLNATIATAQETPPKDPLAEAEKPPVKTDAPPAEPVVPPVKADSPPAAKPDAPAAKPDAPAAKPDAPAAKPDAAKPEAEAVKPDGAAPAAKPEPDKKADDPPKPEEDANKSEVQSGPLAGHSNHGEIFNEGARQKAYLMSGMSNIQFDVTTTSEEAQKFINQGVSQLHGFWYFESERSFRQAASLDPECAMAYWGMAMSNMGNAKRSKGFIEEANKRKNKISAREKMYVEALHGFINGDTSTADKKKARAEKYIRSLEKILYDHPDDTEAKAFVALELWKRRSDGLRIPSFLAIDALLSEVFAANPLHPSHHYRIHLWDSERPEKALQSAATCGQTTPGIAHMWHMPGHIFSKLKRYDDAVFQQEASARVDHAHMIRDLVLPDQIHNYAHNNEWLIRNLIFVGRKTDALNLAKNMIELPRHPKYNNLKKRGCSASYGRQRLLQVCGEFELWGETIALCNSPYLEAVEDKQDQVSRLLALGRAHVQLGNVDAGIAILAELQAPLAAEIEKRDVAIKNAIDELKEEDEKKRKIAAEKIKKDKTRAAASRISGLEKAIAELEGRAASVAGDHKTALEKFAKARVSGYPLAVAQIGAGENDKAVAEMVKYLGRHPKETMPLAQTVMVLNQVGKVDDAKKRFEELRELSAPIDLTSPIFQRLEPLAVEWGYDADWRIEAVAKDDIGIRPALDDLGPFRWQPAPAPSWALEGADGKRVCLSDYEGKPVVVIFFLGYGCLHCAEQLHAFAPKIEEFKQAGLEVVAITSDNHEGLKKSIEDYDGGPLPISLIADPKLESFRNYGAYDDFESMPLHGTFLIDGQGLIRWHDISYEPFMEPDFVIKEAKRLLTPQVGDALAVAP